jgi:DNA polymerase IV
MVKWSTRGSVSLVDFLYQATNKAEQLKLQEKERYFRALHALDDSSDDEEDTSTARKYFSTTKKIPSIRRTTSAPASSVSIVKETPLLVRKSMLNITETATPRPNNPSSDSVCDTSIIKETPPFVHKKPSAHISETVIVVSSDSSDASDTSVKETTQSEVSRRRPHQERRSVSDPTIGSASLSLPYSVGIAQMLGKRTNSGKGTMPPNKKVRKAPPLKLAPAAERIFTGKVFYFFPPGMKTKISETRITRAREHGAIWVDELTDDTTHVIVEQEIALSTVLAFLKLKNLPERVTVVNTQYPIDCIKYMSGILDHKQRKYAVPSERISATAETARQLNIPNSDSSIHINNGKSASPKCTPPRSQKSTQASPTRGDQERLIREIPLPIKVPDDSDLVENRDEETVEHRKCPQYGDELDEMIKVARVLGDVLLENEEDDLETERLSSHGDSKDERSSSDDEQPTSRSGVKRKKNVLGSGINQASFKCMTGGTGIISKDNPNARTIETLQMMADYYIRTQDSRRQLAYRKAIGELKKQTSLISTYDQAIELNHVGKRLANKIVEIVTTGRLRRLDNALSEPGDLALQLFMKIYGVGPSQASKWVQQGHRTLEDLKAKVDLTENQLMGIERMDDLQTGIPRDEVTALGDIVRKMAAAVDAEVEMTIGGSYRRGAASSGDIDCLFTKAGTTESRELLFFLEELVNRLEAIEFLVFALAVPSDDGPGSKWHGCCVLPSNPIWRRIDFLLVPETELGAALIYFTGDDIFNRSLRLLASRKGWRLNQRGLYKDVFRGPGRDKMTAGTLIEGADEKKIFEALGVPYRPPHERICA